MNTVKAALIMGLLLPLAAWSGVISGNITILKAGKEKPAGDTLVVVLTSPGDVAAAKALAAAAIRDTTNAYSAYDIFLDGTGEYLLHIMGKTQVTELAAPITIQVYDEPVEYNLVLTPVKAGTEQAEHPYTMRRK